MKIFSLIFERALLKNRTSHFALIAVLLLCFCSPARGRADGVLFTGMTPSRGPVGTQVIVTGSGFNSSTANSIRVNGTLAAINQITSTNLRFTVGAGTTSGNVVLTSDGINYTNFSPFVVTRTVAGQLVLPRGVGLNGYNIVAGKTVVTPGANGEFTVQVPLDSQTTIWAFREENDPAFLAIVPPVSQQVALNARSTAIAMAFISPAISSRNESVAQSIVTRLNGLPEVDAAARIIEATSADGISYLNDARFENALAQLVSAFLASSPTPQSASLAAFKPNTPRFTYLRDLDPNVLGTPLTLDSKILEPGGGNTTDFLFNYSPLDISYQDWLVEWFELDPDQFQNGMDDVLRMVSTDNPRKLSNVPFAQGLVRANLPAGEIDLLGKLGEFLRDQAFPPSENDYSPSDFLLDREVPAVYISQAYSGNIWYGTSFFTTPNVNQTILLGRLNAMDKWEKAHMANCIIAAIDLAGAAVDLGDFFNDPSAVTKILFGVMLEVEKTMQTHRGRTDLSYDEAMDITTTAVKAIIQGVIAESLEGGIGAILGKFGKIANACFKSAFDITGKISNVGQSFERSIGLMTPTALAIERSVVVVGHPFDPVIRGFWPTSGRGGDVVTIEGYNFPSDPSEVEVSFVTFASTTDPDVPTEKLPAQVLTSSPNSLAIAVPTNWFSKFPAGKAFLSVETTLPISNKKLTTTIPLEDPYREFHFIFPPTILDVNPKPVAPAGRLSIHGTNFDAFNPGKHRVIIDGGAQLIPDMVYQDFMVVSIGNLPEGPHTVAVKIGTEAASPPFAFTVQVPPGVPEPNTGLSITISKADYSNNSEDGEISILEAFLIANGTLGRPIREHDPCEFLSPDEPGSCPYRRREIDSITGSGGGAGSEDSIRVSASLEGQTVAGNATLPFSNGDFYNLNGLVLQTPLIFDAVAGATLVNATLENITGHGLHLRNGATGNIIERITVTGASGHGVFLDQNATDNRLLSLRVVNAGQHGLYLSGPQVNYNVVAVPGFSTSDILGQFDSCGGNGVRLDNGASYNRVHPSTVRSNGSAGILITGPGTRGNLIGRIDGSLPRSGDTYRNNGPGVHLTAGVQGNVVRYVNPSGNNGPGVLLEGADCAFNQLDGIQAGMDFFSEDGVVALPNQGSGIHLRNGAHHNLVGSLDGTSFGGRTIIGGNRDDGILIEGANTAYNTINRCHIGFLDILSDTTYGPNGQNGIRIRNGSHHNVLGALWSFHDLHIVASVDAGILIEGPGTDYNEIIGNQIGGDHDFEAMPEESFNRIGVHIRNEAKGNIIGHAGDEFFAMGKTFRFRNVIANCSEAGVVFENCGGVTGLGGALIDPNICRNNKIGEEDQGGEGPNEVGVLIKGNAWGNIVGGKLPGQGNIIVNNNAAGIRIDGNVVPGGKHANLLIGNFIEDTGIFEAVLADYLSIAPPGIGVHVRGNSIGNWVGDSGKMANWFSNNIAGIYIESSTENTVAGNEIYDSILAGIILRNASSNRVGTSALQGNNLVGNGDNGPQAGGLLITGGGHNEIQSNTIWDNNGPGIYITNSIANRIGATVAGNQINRNASHGIHITGLGSTGNTVQKNAIGNEALLPAANLGDGIRIDGGASGNVIGGMISVQQFNTLINVPAPNIISHNTGAGVHINGTASTGNSIQYNSITANGDSGIITSGGGNFEIPPPVQLLYDGATLTGNADTTKVPPGSTIQVFFDPDLLAPEGDLWVGDATVLAGGAWSMTPSANLAGRRVTMTSTHAANRSTSQFGTATALQTSFTVARVDNTPAQNAPAGSLVPALRLALSTINLEALVSSLRLQLSVTFSASHIARFALYHDLDSNGIISSGDALLSDSPTNNAGELIFILPHPRIPPNTTQQWIVAVTLNASTPVGTALSLSVTAASNIVARIGHSAGAFVSPMGSFPINSATFSVTAPAQPTISTWRQLHFTESQLQNTDLSGDLADANNNGIINLLEYAFNMDPIIDESGSSLDSGKGIPAPEVINLSNQDYFAIRYLRRKNAPDLDYSVHHSQALSIWQSQTEAPSLFEAVDQQEIDGEMELISVRSTIPMKGSGAVPKQFLRVGVRLQP